MRIRVQGRQPLRGTYRVSGNSNAAVALIAASMLSEAPSSFSNVPETVSVGIMLEVESRLASRPNRMATGDSPHRKMIGQPGARTYRRAGRDAALPGLDPARRRHARMITEHALSRLHPHLTALRDLGIGINIDGGVIDLKADPWQEREIVLTQTSVTATSLVCMLAAALGGRTVIMNAASEPHIVDLLTALAQMGARVEGAGSNLLTIHGATEMKGAALAVAPDHVEAASVAAIAALTGGRLTIEGTRRRDLRLIAKVYDRLGVPIAWTKMHWLCRPRAVHHLQPRGRRGRFGRVGAWPASSTWWRWRL
jgi:UDP-N-acetylglucosamine 1-carboxyvinyltransferase